MLTSSSSRIIKVDNEEFAEDVIILPHFVRNTAKEAVKTTEEDNNNSNIHKKGEAKRSNNNNNKRQHHHHRHYNQTNFPPFSKLPSTVKCGGHTASSCSACPQGNGASWCNGECEWNYKLQNCIRSSKLSYIHPDYFRIIERYAFQPVITNNGEYVNIIMVRSPFRDDTDAALYKYYKNEILFLGISSFEAYPLQSPNPYSVNTYDERYYLDLFPGFLHMMHNPDEYFPESVKTILMSQSDFNLDEPYKFGQRHHVGSDNSDNNNDDDNNEIIYDFVYSGGDQDVENDCVGWASYNKNFSFVRQALEIMCSSEFNVTGVLVANKNKANTKACTIPPTCADKIVQTTFLDQQQFFTYISKSRWVFLPQICDASPRVSTQALSMDKPLLMNRNIMGGWKYMVPGVTGEEFHDIHDFKEKLRTILDNTRGKHGVNEKKKKSPYTPLDFVRKNYGNELAGKRLLEFVQTHFGDRVDLPEGTSFLIPTGA